MKKMNTELTRQLVNIAIDAACAASEAICEIYQSTTVKTDIKPDHSPLTDADKRSHQIILNHLTRTNIPVLSEEGKEIPYEVRKEWEYLWLVDPLDGTKEFLSRNGEFTVNIALIHRHSPVLGVIAVPVTGDVYFGGKDIGAFVRRRGVDVALPVRSAADLRQPGLRVVASRSHMNEETRTFIESLKNPVLVSKGSSLKFMMLAEGEADIYPRLATTMEWDTAAAQAILAKTGYKLIKQHTNEELFYNKPDLQNPSFICLNF